MSARHAKEVPFERVVFALGIRFVGETSAKLLARHFKNIDALMNASMEELTEVEGVGEVMAASVINYFQNPRNREIVERLRGYGVQMSLSQEATEATGDKLAGLSIVISGVFQKHSRDEYKDLIERNGGKNVGSISAKTSFLVNNVVESTSGKNQKAKELGIEIISEDEFIARFGK